MRHVSAADITERYFADRSDGLRPPLGAEELLVATMIVLRYVTLDTLCRTRRRLGYATSELHQDAAATLTFLIIDDIWLLTTLPAPLISNVIARSPCNAFEPSHFAS